MFLEACFSNKPHDAAQNITSSHFEHLRFISRRAASLRGFLLKQAQVESLSKEVENNDVFSTTRGPLGPLANLTKNIRRANGKKQIKTL
jgi:hypothetical protein